MRYRETVFILLGLLLPGMVGAQEPPPPEESDPRLVGILEALDAGEDTAGILTQARRLAEEYEQELAANPEVLATHLGGLAMDLARSCRSTSELRQLASQLLERTRELFEALAAPARPALADTLSSLGDVAFMRGRWNDAETYDQLALGLRQEDDDAGPLDLVLSRLNLADIHLRQALYDKAEAHLRQAQKISLEAGSKVGQAEVLQRLAIIAAVRHQYDKAQTNLELARQLVLDDSGEDGPDTSWLIDIENDLAGIHVDRRELSAAEHRFRVLLTQLEGQPTAECDDQRATIKSNLAETYRQQGELNLAEPLYREALDEAIGTLGENHPRLIEYFTWSAQFYMDRSQAGFDPGTRRRDLVLAKQYYEAGWELAESQLPPEHPRRGLALHRLGVVYTALGQHKTALEKLGQALAIWESSYSPDHPDVARTLTAMAASLAEAEPDLALSHLDRAVKIFLTKHRHTFPEVRAEALALRAQIHKRQGRDRKALADLEQSLKTIEDLRLGIGGDSRRRARFFAGYIQYFERMINWHLAKGDLTSAVHVVERMRARALVEQLSNSGLLRRELGLAAQKAQVREGELAKKLEILEREGSSTVAAVKNPAKKIDQLRAELEKVRSKLQRVRGDLLRSSTTFTRTTGLNPLELDEIQTDIVPAEGLMLLYQISAESGWLFVIPGALREPKVVALELDAELASLFEVEPGPLTKNKMQHILEGADTHQAGTHQASIPGLIDILGTSPSARHFDPASEARFTAQLHGLWNLLVPAEIRQGVAEASSILVVPSGSLQRLPFEALLTQPASRLDQGHWWIEDGPVLSYAVSATALAATRRARPRVAPPASRHWLLTVADPSLGQEQQDRLNREGWRTSNLWSVAEGVENLRKSFPSTGIRDLLGEEATEAGVRTNVEGARYIHFATHAQIIERREHTNAALLLASTPGAGVGPADGFLDLEEIYFLPLRHCELAVVSACSTHVGQIIEGEGVFSLARGFLAAGAHRVVASLWPVEDVSTMEVTSALFAKVAERERTGDQPHFATALRQAKCSLLDLNGNRREWRDPYYWAPFLLIDGGSAEAPPPAEACRSR